MKLTNSLHTRESPGPLLLCYEGLLSVSREPLFIPALDTFKFSFISLKPTHAWDCSKASAPKDLSSCFVVRHAHFQLYRTSHFIGLVTSGSSWDFLLIPAFPSQLGSGYFPWPWRSILAFNSFFYRHQFLVGLSCYAHQSHPYHRTLTLLFVVIRLSIPGSNQQW